MVRQLSLEETQQSIEPVAHSHPEIQLICLFGPPSKSPVHPPGDYYIAVWLGRLPREVTQYKRSLISELTEALKVEVMEVVILNLAPPRTKWQIYKEAKILYQATPGVWPRFSLQTLQEYEVTKNLRTIFDDHWISYIRTQAGPDVSAINKPLVGKYLGALKHYTKWLGLLQWYTYEEFQANEEVCWAVEHGLQLAIQCVIDMGIHILAGKDLARPEDYHQVILAMGEQGVTPRQFAEQIAYMADLQAMLVHRTLEVEVDIVYDVLQNNLSDFTEFANYIVDFVEGE
jgi:uncharacterized protein YutE (UPF0331/DUF86 family)